MSDYEDLQKRCQRGATNLNDANNLLAECYGMLGKLGADLDSANKHWENESNNVQALTAEVVRLKAENEALRNQVQSMINQTTPLVPVPGDPGWSRRITIDELQAEVEALCKALIYIRDTSDDWHVCEKAADALIDNMRRDG